METGSPLRILIVEDVPSDAELAERELRKGGIAFTSLRVDTKAAFLRALEDFRPDLILSDYAMPEFDGMQALELSLAQDADRPFILLTGSLNEETAVACMKAGALDYVIKERIARLPLAVLGALDQQKARLEKAETAKELTAIYENAPVIMMLMDKESRICKLNARAAALSGGTEAAMLMKRAGEALLCINESASPDGCGFGVQCERCTIRRIVKDTIETGRSHYQAEGTFAYRSVQGGGEMSFLLSSTRLYLKGESMALISLLDITERKRTEEKLLQTEENFRRSLDESPLGIRVLTGEGETLYANRAFLDTFGFDGIDELNEIPFEKLYTPECLAEVEARAKLRKQGDSGPSEYEISIVRKDGEIRHLRVFRKEVLWNSERRFQTIYHDVTERKQAEKKLQESLEQLRQAFGATIQVIVSAVEARDPYTAGHQSRSADLARAIATEMGLDPDRIDAIRMAGSIHDLGKLSIPAEILSKPARLSEIEYSLIQEHPRSGYEILKNVESPWPLAEIIYQHHERMDGSGYPRQLKGEQILMEARILAVSDVVESMASHRPYRSALGIDAALEEIDKHRGTLYDAAAADACLRIFREKGFQIEVPHPFNR